MVLGVCGKIASGKSEVLKILREKGFYCVEADKIVHDLYKKGAQGARKIEVVFGKKFLKENGEVDRLKLRDEVFEDENKLKLLNDIIHPVVYEEIKSVLSRHHEKNIAIESVYFDSEFLGDFVSELLWIERPKEGILKVLIDDRGFTRDLAEKVFDYIQKPKEIDFVLKNDGSLSKLKEEVLSLF